MVKVFLLFIAFLLSQSHAQSVKPPMVLMDIMINKNLSTVDLRSGGGSIGGFGGGDTTDRRRLAAWFYGQNQIDVCYNMTKTFGLSKADVEATIVKVFVIWQKYFSDKNINLTQNKSISTNFKLLGKCKGGEDLVLYFGTGPIYQNLLDLRAFQSLSNPVAYANKTHVSEDLTWSRGYIRFVESYKYKIDDSYYPNWSNIDHFSQMLLHEVGHVLGFAHIPETIMTGSIVKDVLIENKDLPTVDLQKELFPCTACNKFYALHFTKDVNLFSSEAQIYFSNDTVSVMQKNYSESIIPISIIKKNILSPLISMFDIKEPTLDLNHIYFISYEGKNLTLVKEDLELNVYENGTLQATFKRSK